MFATWFRVHTIALICEILPDEPLAKIDWQFNTFCSMGWHRKWDITKHQITKGEKVSDFIDNVTDQVHYRWYESKRRLNRTIFMYREMISRNIHRIVG
jgi:hypothetical protein